MTESYQRIPLEILIQTSEVHPLQMARELDLSYVELALVLGCSVDAVKSWASRRRNPSLVMRRYAALRLQAIKASLGFPEP